MSEFSRKQLEFDPSVFGDPLAEQIDWTHVNSEDSQGRKRKLVQIDPDTYKFRPTISVFLYGLALASCGLFCMVFLLFGDDVYLLFKIFMLILGLILIWFSVSHIVSVSSPLVFDLRKKQFRAGYAVSENDAPQESDPNKILVPLDSLYALQIITRKFNGCKNCAGNELNLVFENGRRVHVLSHSDSSQLAEDAATLSQHLGKPLWNMDRAFPMLNREPFDPAQFNDRIAEDIEWSSLAGEAESGRTHELHLLTPDRYEFRAVNNGCAYFLICSLSSVFLLVLAFDVMIGIGEAGKLGFWGRTLVTLLPGGLSVYIGARGISYFFRLKQPIVFDKASGYFWQGKKRPSETNSLKATNSAKLIDIYALQVASKLHKTEEDRKYYTHEINLILKYSDRMNVIYHGDLDAIRSQAKQLAEWLDVPLWDVAKEGDPDNE